MRTLTTVLALLALATAPAVAQKVCYTSNPTIQPGNVAGLIPVGTMALRVDPQQNMLFTGLEWFGQAASNTSGIRTANMFVWDLDPVTNGPGNQLSTGTLTFQGDWAWYTATINFPVLMSAGATYFVGVQLVSGGFVPLGVPASSTPGMVANQMWLDRGAGWAGPYSTSAYGFRLHCGVNSGSYTTVGTGQTGSVGVAQMAGLGFPNLGNPVAFQLWNVVASAPAVVFIGLPGNSPTPFGPLHMALVVVGVDGTSGIRRSMAVGLTLPNSPNLTGFALVAQGAVLDAASGQLFGIVLSDAIQMSIGD